MSNEVRDIPQVKTEFAGTEVFEGQEAAGGAGSSFQSTFDAMNPARGDHSTANAFPSSGGRFTGGVPARGDRWRQTVTLTIGGTDVYQAGTILEAATNNPGQNTANWIKYAIQA